MPEGCTVRAVDFRENQHGLRLRTGGKPTGCSPRSTFGLSYPILFEGVRNSGQTALHADSSFCNKLMIQIWNI
jgi:hypothetical protein